jgi:hypothetical protein
MTFFIGIHRKNSENFRRLPLMLLGAYLPSIICAHPHPQEYTQ